jgi:hypothetical protein
MIGCHTPILIPNVVSYIVNIMNVRGPSDVICEHCTLKIIKWNTPPTATWVRTRVMGGYDSTRERGLVGVFRGFHIP